MATSPASQPPKKSNIGGLARRITMSLAEHQEHVDRAFELGIEQGEDLARRMLREEIRQELEDELTGVPDCPACAALREVKELRKRLAVARLDVDRERAVRRNWIRRQGLYNYRGTVADAKLR